MAEDYRKEMEELEAMKDAPSGDEDSNGKSDSSCEVREYNIIYFYFCFVFKD